MTSFLCSNALERFWHPDSRRDESGGLVTVKIWEYQVIVAATLAVLLAAERTEAQTVKVPPGTRTVTVAPAPEYEAGGLKRKLLGGGWREVWITPVDAPVFDMGSYAGGLKVGEPGGGKQSLTLTFTENNGWREYQFRSVNKFPVARAMPPAIRDTPLGAIIQDQVSSFFPAGGVVVPPLLEAIGALHVNPELFMMPDDPRLGSHRATYAGLLGTVELSPQEGPKDEPGFAGSRQIKNTEEFLKDIESSREHRLDERELLAVRFVDFIINDNDRTPDNMRFARFGSEGAYRWRPIARDRDRVFHNAGGWLVDYLIRPFYPKLIGFEPEISLEGLTFDSNQLDRRLLQRLTLADFDEVARRVQRAIDNKVIDGAVAKLPSKWRDQTTVPQLLRTNLRARRDQLPAVAREFYELLADDVDIHGTDEKDRVAVARHADGRLTVTVTGLNDPVGREPFSRRTFTPVETEEVRIYLHGGDDIAVVSGARRRDIKVRIIGGGGDDVLADSVGGTRFYDEDGDNRFVTTSGTKVKERPWKEPKRGAGIRLDAPWRPDWGGSSGWGPTFDYADGAGLIVGYGPRYLEYGFRRLPHRLKASANLLVGLENLRPGVSADVDYRRENSPLALTLDARATRFDAFRFNGFGNDSERASRRLTLVDQDRIAIEPNVVWHIGWRSREDLGGGLGGEDPGDASSGKDSAGVAGGKEKMRSGLRPLVGELNAGPVLLWNRAEARPGSPFALERSDSTSGRVGVQAGLELDRTGQGLPSDRGWRFQAEAAAFPPLWDVEKFFNTASAVGSVYLPLVGDGTHLAVRAGGAAASGPFPLQHTPSIGGRETLRGYTYRRFSGDRTAFGSAEVRVPVGEVSMFVRWQVGVFGLADAGRVWYKGDSPGKWHTGVGGGLWFSSLGQAFSLAYAYGEDSRLYAYRGVSF